MRPRSPLALTLPAAALLFAAAAHADEVPPMREDARALLVEGMARFEAGDFAGAAEKFREARAIDAHRDLAYAEAQAQRRGGHCDAAIPLYEAFLATQPPEAEAQLARANMARCQSSTPTAEPPVDPAGESATFPPAATPPPPPVPLAPPVAPTRAPVSTGPSRHETKPAAAPSAPSLGSDAWFWAALGAGATATGVGLGFLAASDGEATAANDATTLDAYVDARSAHEDLATAGTVMLAVGGSFLVAAAVRAVWVGATPTSPPVTARAGSLAITLPFGS